MTTEHNGFNSEIKSKQYKHFLFYPRHTVTKQHVLNNITDAQRQSELLVHELLDLREHSSILTMTLLRSEIDSLIVSVCCIQLHCSRFMHSPRCLYCALFVLYVRDFIIIYNKKLSWCWQRARRVCRSVEVKKHFESIPSKI